jgi:hypothetical protein
MHSIAENLTRVEIRFHLVNLSYKKLAQNRKVGRTIGDYKVGLKVSPEGGRKVRMTVGGYKVSRCLL